MRVRMSDLTGEQIRAGRAFLRIEQSDLALAAGDVPADAPGAVPGPAGCCAFQSL